ncbi:MULTISPECIES: hypothetical protein [Methylobacterium]|nr:hypothetical protein [Methylobacterium sp. DB0501]
MMAQVRRKVDHSQDATAEAIRSHIRARLERLVSALKGGAQ